jgi:hypothetical protein
MQMSAHGLPCCATIDDSHTHTIYFTESAHAHTHTPYILQKARTHHIFYRRGDTAQNSPRRTYIPQSLIADTACEMRAPHFFNHCCVSCAAAQKQGICKMSVHGLTSCATIDESHKVEYIHQHTRTIFRECARIHTHTHHIFYRSARTSYILQERRQCTRRS